MTVSMRVMSAGDGYKYLLRTVAAADGNASLAVGNSIGGIAVQTAFIVVADLAYRHVRLALQYDGAGHRTREQQARDARRDRYGQARGWTTLRVTWADGREDFRGVVAVVRRRLGHSAST